MFTKKKSGPRGVVTHLGHTKCASGHHPTTNTLLVSLIAFRHVTYTGLTETVPIEKSPRARLYYLTPKPEYFPPHRLHTSALPSLTRLPTQSIQTQPPTLHSRVKNNKHREVSQGKITLSYFPASPQPEYLSSTSTSHLSTTDIYSFPNPKLHSPTTHPHIRI